MYETTPLPPELRAIFERPLAERAVLLTEWLDRLTMRDLCVAYPAIIDNVFGNYADHNPIGRQGWALDSIGQGADLVTFRTVHEFLRPRGPLMCIAAKLTNEASIKFHFPVARLPHGFKTQLRYGELSLFFAERLGTQGPVDANASVYLGLDAFELLIFNIVAYAVYPERPGALASPAYNDIITDMSLLHRTPGCIEPPVFQSTTVPQVTSFVKEEYKDSLYVFLVDGYFEYFFAGEHDAVAASMGSAGSQTAQTQLGVRSSVSHVQYPTPQYMSPLIRRSALSDGTSVANGNGNGNGNASTASSTTSVHVPSKFEGGSTRRGQIMLMAVAHFWLAMPPQYPGTACVPTVMAASKRFDAGADPSTTKLNYSVISPTDNSHFTLPSVDLLTLVRIVVKHVHYFLNSLPERGASKHADVVKKYTVDTLRNALYPYLRQLFQRWPLDGSFRMALELWLSFIQPWRYNDPSAMDGRSRQPPSEIDEEWEGFIASNYPFYSVLFQVALWRLARMEYNSPRLAVCLFRTSKVFATPRLAMLLRALDSEVGQALDYSKAAALPQSPYSSSHRSTFHAGPGLLGSNLLGLTFGSPLRASTNKMSAYGAKAVVSLLELEGHDGHIDLLFTERTNEMVVEIMRGIRLAQQNIELEQKARTALQGLHRHNLIQDTLESCTSFGARLRFSYNKMMKRVGTMLATGASKPSKAVLNGIDEGTPADNPEKMFAGFEGAIGYLAEVFEIRPPPRLEVPDIPLESLEESRRLGSPLTASGLRRRRSRLMSTVDADETGMVIQPDIPDGHPDRGIAQSSEVEWIVLMMLDLSDWFNEMFGDSVRQYYYDRGWMGRLARPFLRPPGQYYECGKVGLGAVQRTLRSVPPRVCLRPLAHRMIVALAMSLTILMVFSILPVTAVQVVACLIVYCILYSVFGAFREVMSGGPPPEVFMEPPDEVRRRLNGGFRPGGGEPRN